MARLLLNQLLVHVGLGVASLVSGHSSPIWYYINNTIGFTILGFAHFVCAVILGFGLWRRSSFVLFALLMSVSVYLLKLGLIVAAIARSWVEPGVRDVSGETGIFTLGLVLLAMATYWESFRVRRSGRQSASEAR